MGSKNRKTVTCYFLAAALAVFALTALADSAILRELKLSFAETEALLGGIAGSAESGEELLRWMKETPDAAFLHAGQKQLNAYGYNEETQTVWDKKYQAAKHHTIAASVVFDLLLLALLFLFWTVRQRLEDRRESELEHLLRKIQDTDAPLPDLSDSSLNHVLRDRITSLWTQIRTDHNILLLEKESTKTLVTDISHQLKTPVAALKTTLELLSTEHLNESERQEFFMSCKNHVDGLENLTSSLVNVSRMEKDMIQVCAVPARIHETVIHAVNRVYEKAQEKKISIEMTNEFEENLLIPHDVKWTAEAFINILDNAIKYSPENSHITIRLELLASYVKIDFEDEGRGIPCSEYANIFKRFYRGSSSQHTEGSGVGLYLAREILEQQGGSVYVHRRPFGKAGSMFSVQLPKSV